MIPGLGNQLKDLPVDESQIKHIEAIIQSMTPAERRDPDILNASRKRRVARGSGSDVSDINRLLKQFETMRKMMKGLGDMGRKRGKRLPFRLPF